MKEGLAARLGAKRSRSPAPSAAEPSEETVQATKENVDKLVGMGFAEAEARRALENGLNDPNLAAQYLREGLKPGETPMQPPKPSKRARSASPPPDEDSAGAAPDAAAAPPLSLESLGPRLRQLVEAQPGWDKQVQLSQLRVKYLEMFSEPASPANLDPKDFGCAKLKDLVEKCSAHVKVETRGSELWVALVASGLDSSPAAKARAGGAFLGRLCWCWDVADLVSCACAWPAPNATFRWCSPAVTGPQVILRPRWREPKGHDSDNGRSRQP